MRILQVIGETAGRSRPWIAAITQADARAKTAGNPLRTYLISFRIDEEHTSLQGADAERRAGLTKLIEGLPAREKHHSTSSWIVELHIPKAQEIAKLLAPPIDPAIDYLSVMEVKRNRHQIGDAKLKS